MRDQRVLRERDVEAAVESVITEVLRDGRPMGPAFASNIATIVGERLFDPAGGGPARWVEDACRDEEARYDLRADEDAQADAVMASRGAELARRRDSPDTETASSG